MSEENRKTEKPDMLSDEVMEKVAGGDGGEDLPPVFVHTYVCPRCGLKCFGLAAFGAHFRNCQVSE